MYRMVLVKEENRSLQKIYWRANPNEDLRVYTLNTVTYGTRSAAFLAIRCLKQLGLENEEQFPKAANIILHNFYVDDLLFGVDSEEEAILLSKEIANILKTGGFILRKWLSNSSRVLTGILGDDSSPSEGDLPLGEKSENKTLGLHWSFKDDCLLYHKSEIANTSKQTKRSILSSIAQIYDPLGLLSPCIILGKIIMQKLWLEKVGWDESLPSHIFSSWNKLKNQFIYFNELSIARQVILSKVVNVEIHGFCDSSIEAYGACLYLKSVNSCGETKVSLVYSKAKVAPLKVVTLPRLELCGALVLAQLVSNFKRSVDLNISRIYLWTDSTVVLGWIAQSPHNLHTYIGNRVSQIQSLTLMENWRHVSSKDNPADLVSRGVYPEILIKSNLWWNGPSWLSQDCIDWPNPIIDVDSLPEMKRQVQICHEVLDIIDWGRFSNFLRLERCTAYIFRFAFNCKTRIKEERKAGPLSADELKNAVNSLLVICQRESFPEEYSSLLNGKVCKKGPLSTLNPFIDSNGILRVGGRLQLSNIDYAMKHPAVISSKHKFCKLLFEYKHKTLLHAGPQLLLSAIRENYWPIGGRNLAKITTHKCIRCFRAKPRPLGQIMGSLPKDRVTPAPPFYTTGVDYAGPFGIKSRGGRGASITKCYLCLFVCFSTRAIHLELVSDLTSEAFLATLRRFIARRGRPTCMWSDNGLNFVGANSELKDICKFLQEQNYSLIESLGNEGITWKFIPAHSPNFGGIWEAGVKACKHHIKRIMGNASLTFENFYTLLTQIEATLNSRPMIPISSDPNDLDVLTPSHFLIGRRLTALPDLDFRDTPDNRLSKFQHLQKLYQHFWSRWSKEYLVTLQTRLKWKFPQRTLQVGELVVVHEDNLPPLCWKLGRVLELHFGSDKLCRVATIKTLKGSLKRPISKLCPLPIEDSI